MPQTLAGNYCFKAFSTRMLSLLVVAASMLLPAWSARAATTRPTPKPLTLREIAGRGKPIVQRNPQVQTPFDRVIAPHMPEYVRAAEQARRTTGTSRNSASHNSFSRNSLRPAGQGVGNTGVQFPGFVAAPFLTLTGGVQTTNAGGYQSYTSVAGDFNGDGYPDVAVAESNTTLHVVLNPGPQSNLTQGIQTAPNSSAELPGGANYLFWLEAADLNGDGKLDLIGEDYHNSDLVIWMGNGDGTFADATTVPIAPKSGGYLSFLGNGGGFVVGDFNGDGAPDVAVVVLGGFLTTTVTELTFLNDGHGQLTPGPETDTVFNDYYSGADAGQLALVKNAGKITGIAFLIRNGGFFNEAVNGASILILGSNGDGSFAPAVEPSAPAVAETVWTQVPRTRLVATSLTTKDSTTTTDIVFVSGDGAVYDAPYTPQSGSTALTSAKLLAGSNSTVSGGTRYNPYVAHGPRAADSAAAGQTTPAFPFFQGINVADANNDGLPDLFVYSSGAAYVYLNDGTGAFSTAPSQLITGHAAMQEPQPQDFDGSGKTSFVVLDSQQLELGYYQGDGSGLFYGAAAVAGTGASDTLSISDNITVQATADLNGDGLLDVIAQDWSSATAAKGFPALVIGINNGKKVPSNQANNFTFTTILSAADFATLGATFVEPVTVPGPNGLTNVLLATKTGLTAIPVTNGVAGAPVALLPAGVFQCSPNFADVGDVNGDGLADVVVAYGGSSSCNGAPGIPSGIFTFFGQPDGSLTPGGFLAYGSSLYQVRLTDLNGDGWLDVAVNDFDANSATYALSVLPNLTNGSGGFDLANAAPVANNYVVSDIIAGDYNGDGKQDLTLTMEGLFDPASGGIVPETWGVMQLAGQGNFKFGTPKTLDSGYFPQWGSYADFNGDGAPDLVLAEYGDTLTLTDQSHYRVQLPSLVQVLPNLGGGNFGPSIGLFDGYFEDTVTYDNVPSYTLAAYTFTGNFGSGTDLLVSGSFNSAEFLNQGTDALSLTASGATAYQGDNVVLTAKLTQQIANPNPSSGAVSFFSNGILIGASEISGDGTATLTSDVLPLGVDSLTAVYAGDAHFNAVQGAASITVATPPPPPPPPAPDFTFSVPSSSLQVAQGSTGVMTLNLAGNSSFNGSISFSCAGAPAETICTVNPASLTLTGNQSGSVSLILSTTAKGAKALAALRTGATGMGSVVLAGLLMIAMPRRRRYARYFLLPLLLAAGVIFGGLTGCGGSKGQPGTPVGSSTLTITANLGSISHSQTINLQITAAK